MADSSLNNDTTAAAVTGRSQVYTYHCICTQLVLASTTLLPDLSARQLDKSHILPLPTTPSSSADPHYATLHGTIQDAAPIVLTLDDGFEKRYLHRCPRCELVIGYQLDWSQYADDHGQSGRGRREDVVYLLPGGLLTTEEMQRVGKGLDLTKRVGLVVQKI